jgi:hypothetical protein
MSTCWIRRWLESDRDICFVGNVVGENRSQTIRDGTFLELTAADHGRILNDDAGLSGKVYGYERYEYPFPLPLPFPGRAV